MKQENFCSLWDGKCPAIKGCFARKIGIKVENSRVFATVRAYVDKILGQLVSSNDGDGTDILGTSKKSFPGWL